MSNLKVEFQVFQHYFKYSSIQSNLVVHKTETQIVEYLNNSLIIKFDFQLW
jgi:hypothetical protein